MVVFVHLFRAFSRFRLYMLINVIGLALSLACVILISRYVYNEVTTDWFNRHYDRMAYVVRLWPDGNREPIFFTADNALMRSNYKHPLDMPEIEKYTSFVSVKEVAIQVDEKILPAHVLATDSVFLQIFDFPLLLGNRAELLRNPKGAVISRDFARRLFGTEDPVGKQFLYDESLLTVEGVTGEPATQSSLAFDLLISKDLQFRWPPPWMFNAALLAPNSDLPAINTKLAAIHADPDRATFLYELLPMRKSYMDTSINKGESSLKQGNRGTLQILIAVGVLILFVGIFNFLQISSVILQNRQRELGMKRIFGAELRLLFGQLYLENLVLVAFSLVLGWSMIELSAGLQERVLRLQIVNNNTFNLLLSLVLLLGLPLVVALYSVLRQRFSQPALSLKTSYRSQQMGARPLFLVAQYSITFFLIVSALFFVKQLHFLLNMDPGYSTANLVKAWFQRPVSKMVYTGTDLGELDQQKQYIKDRIHRSPLFTGATYGESPYELSNQSYTEKRMRVPGGEFVNVDYIRFSYDYFTVYNIPLQAGEMPVGQHEVLLNETARKLFAAGGADPQHLEVDREESSLLVKGVTRDFLASHQANAAKPLVIYFQDRDGMAPQKITAEIVPGRTKEALRFLADLHEETVGGDFEYAFVQDEVRNIYSKDRQIGLVYSLFSFIAILISSLGLFGVSLLDIQQRRREIGIRKVNGALTVDILRMFLGKYNLLLIISFVLAVPAIWVFLTRYTEQFANRATLSWWLFLLAFVLTATISLLTLSWQTRRAARTNPAEVIRNE